MLPLRSNIPEISKYTFSRLDEGYYERAIAYRDGGSFVVGGDNYGQGSSREHAAIGPAYLGVRAVLVKSFARIHWQNLVNFGVVPLEFLDAADCERIGEGDDLVIEDVHQGLRDGRVTLHNRSRGEPLTVGHSLSERQLEVLLAGGLINWVRARKAA